MRVQRGTERLVIALRTPHRGGSRRRDNHGREWHVSSTGRHREQDQREGDRREDSQCDRAGGMR